MAKGESRGGGYDAWINQQQEKRKTLGATTRESVGSSSSAPTSGGDLQAPSSLGDIIAPSAPGRAAPPANAAEYGQRVAENQTYLESPETRGMMLQFATAMLGGSNPMHALGLALQMPGRMALAENKRLNAEDVIAARAERLQMAQERLGMAQDKFSSEQDKQKNREAIFAALGNMSDENLMKAANELLIKGDLQGAETAMRLRKATNPDPTGLLAQFAEYKKEGYTGDLIQFHRDMSNVNIIEEIRRKKAAGIPTTPAEDQVYNDSLSSNPFYSIIAAAAQAAANSGGGGATTSTTTSTATPTPTQPQSGIGANNVPFKVIK